jgi:hypothetical protein
MIVRLGLSLEAAAIHAVLVTRNRVIWQSSMDASFGTAGSDEIGRLLAPMPRRFGLRRATIALGLSWAQVKQIEGLPPVKDDATRSRLVRENSASFFLHGGSRMAVSEIVRLADATIWAAAFDHTVVSAILGVLGKRGFTNVRVMPSVVALASLASDGVHYWEDGGAIVEATTEKHEVSGIRRVASRDVLDSPPIAPDDQPAAAAYGAAIAARRAPFVWRPEPDAKLVARARRARVTVAASVAVVTGFAMLTAPGARAARTVREMSMELADLRATQIEVARVQGELRRAAATIDRVDKFSAQRGHTTMLLGALSQALPESTALVTLRLDSLEGSFVALTPHAADILTQLVSVTEISAPKIVGSLTKETVGGATLERVTVRFKRPRPTARGRS